MYQQPTLSGVHVRSIRDALHIFYAVARHVLPIISRRLDPDERKSIAPGNVYVWEERSANSDAAGLTMERWTDGMTWGPSRVRDEFLYYEPRENDKHLSATLNNILQRPRRNTPKLVKQTYSVFVSLPEDRPLGLQRKWHITAYWSQETVDNLKSVSEIGGVGDVLVPTGWFKSARAAKTRKHEPQGEPPAQTTFALTKTNIAPHHAPRPFGNSPAGCPPYENLHVFPCTFDTQSSNEDGMYTPSLSHPYPQHESRYHSASPSLSQSSATSSDDNSPSRSYPLTPPHQPSRSALELVPLSYLEGTVAVPRNTMDEQLLQQLASLAPLRPSPGDFGYLTPHSFKG